jgi:acyl-CoA synthetase (AMP-forming)/AMP-acid ligase II
MTEIVPVCRASLEEKLDFHGDGDLVGTPFPEVAVRLADDGELLVAGPHLFRGYLGAPPAVEHATGDLASIDHSGRVILRGRKKDMIIRGGHNIYPALLEPVIREIAGVRRCALVACSVSGTSDERVVLAVEPDDGQHPARLHRRLAQELRSGPHCIEAAAQPDRIVIYKHLPLVARSDDVDRQALRQRLVRGSGC